MKILLTCPPMIGLLEHFQEKFNALDWDVFVPDFNQTMSEEALIKLLPSFDGWIIGDDTASERVIKAGADGQLVEQEVTVQHTVRIDPPPPTPDEVEQVMAYIVEDDPEPEVLERFTRDSLHRRPSRSRRDATSRTGPEGTVPGIPRDVDAWRDQSEGMSVRPQGS